MILGEVLKLYIAPNGTSGVRDSRDKIFLKKDFGIEDDKFAGKEIDRSIMIIGKNSYDIASENGIKLPEVALGENILLNFDPHTLDFETKIKIGEAILEITKSCTLCKHLAKYDKSLPKLILKHRGIYCKIVQSGTISKNDKVELL